MFKGSYTVMVTPFKADGSLGGRGLPTGMPISPMAALVAPT